MRHARKSDTIRETSIIAIFRLTFALAVWKWTRTYEKGSCCHTAQKTNFEWHEHSNIGRSEIITFDPDFLALDFYFFVRFCILLSLLMQFAMSCHSKSITDHTHARTTEEDFGRRSKIQKGERRRERERKMSYQFRRYWIEREGGMAMTGGRQKISEQKTGSKKWAVVCSLQSNRNFSRQ